MRKKCIGKSLRLLCLLAMPAFVSAEERLERWGCADSGGTGAIYFLDIYPSKVIYDYRDGYSKNLYELLTSPNADRLIAATPTHLNPIVEREPETCGSCLTARIMIFDRKPRRLLMSSLIAGSDFSNPSELVSRTYDTKTKCDRLDN